MIENWNQKQWLETIAISKSDFTAIKRYVAFYDNLAQKRRK